MGRAHMDFLLFCSPVIEGRALRCLFVLRVLQQVRLLEPFAHGVWPSGHEGSAGPQEWKVGPLHMDFSSKPVIRNVSDLSLPSKRPYSIETSLHPSPQLNLRSCLLTAFCILILLPLFSIYFSWLPVCDEAFKYQIIPQAFLICLFVHFYNWFASLRLFRR